VKVLIGGILQAFAGMSVDDYEAAAHSFLHEGRHPTLGHRFRDCGYRRRRAGQAGADLEPDRPGLGLLVLHDDPEREFDYVTEAERSLEEAETRGWTVVSIRNDWTTVFDG